MRNTCSFSSVGTFKYTILSAKLHSTMSTTQKTYVNKHNKLPINAIILSIKSLGINKSKHDAS